MERPLSSRPCRLPGIDANPPRGAACRPAIIRRAPPRGRGIARGSALDPREPRRVNLT